MKSFAVGIFLIAVILGFLVGASESPVAGIALTATFGLVASAISLKSKPQDMLKASALDLSRASVPEPNPQRPTEITSATLHDLGLVLAVFSIAFSVGLAAGIASRIKYHKVEPMTALPWQGLEEPRTARKAVDWIVVHKKLRDLGYTDKQIASLYAIEAAQLKKDKDTPALMNEELVSSILQSEAKRSDEKRIPFMAWDPSKRKLGIDG